MQYIILIGVLGIIIVGIALWAFYYVPEDSYDIARVEIKDKVFEVEVSKTLGQQALGLSGRESLSKNKGMLFIYDYLANPSFWMKDMNFSIDIIWIKEGRVIGFVEEADPLGFKRGEIFKPSERIDMVLEVVSGTVKELGIESGDNVRVSF